MWIAANSKETQIKRMRPIQSVTVYVDALGQNSKVGSKRCQAQAAPCRACCRRRTRLRNVDGDVGISVANTIAQRHLQSHRNSNVQWYPGASWLFRRQLEQLSPLMQMHVDQRHALLRAYSITNSTLNSQAQLWAYVDVLRYFASLGAVCVPFAFLLKKPKIGRQEDRKAGCRLDETCTQREEDCQSVRQAIDRRRPGPACRSRRRRIALMNLAAIQSALQEAQLDGWLFYDHHHRDPLAYRILGLDAGAHVTRRWFYFIPATGEPRKLVHRIETFRLDSVPGSKTEYSSWQELESELKTLLSGASTIAMQYSPRNAIMYVGLVDAGTIEVLRELGKTIVSSADLVSRFEAALTEAQIASHFEAQRRLDVILAEGFDQIGNAARTGSGTDEFTMVTRLKEAIERAGMVTEHGPNVSSGPNSADSHYEPTLASSRPIRSGDFLLIDIWAKLANDPAAVWYDITWTATVDRSPTDREQLIFTTVRDARDAAIRTVQQAFTPGTPLQGWQPDEAARTVIRNAGFADAFTHRTGHNIATELHGAGAHLDNLETHDMRLILPNTCFSVEPGLYFPGSFGIRSEINMITRPGNAVVTGRTQTELLRL